MEEQKPLNNVEVEMAVNGLTSEEKKSADSYPILIIDDDRWIQRIIAHYLQSWGFKTYSAFNAYDGIALALKHRPTLIILDIIMPEVEGDILLKMLKRIDLTAEIPILIMSSNLNMDILGKTYKDGALAFIAKPFSQQILFEKVRDCMGPAIFNELYTKTESLSKDDDIHDEKVYKIVE